MANKKKRSKKKVSFDLPLEFFPTPTMSAVENKIKYDLAEMKKEAPGEGIKFLFDFLLPVAATAIAPLVPKDGVRIRMKEENDITRIGRLSKDEVKAIGMRGMMQAMSGLVDRFILPNLKELPICDPKKPLALSPAPKEKNVDAQREEEGRKAESKEEGDEEERFFVACTKVAIRRDSSEPSGRSTSGDIGSDHGQGDGEVVGRSRPKLHGSRSGSGEGGRSSGSRGGKKGGRVRKNRSC